MNAPSRTRIGAPGAPEAQDPTLVMFLDSSVLRLLGLPDRPRLARRRGLRLGQRGQPAGGDRIGLRPLVFVDGPAQPLRLGRHLQDRLLAEPADLLAALMAHQVRRPAPLMADLAGGRHLEPFLDAFVSLELGHSPYPRSI